MLALEDRGAVFSDDRTHRYLLWRIWDQDRPFVAFIGLNPSTATEELDDPTVRRCIGFAHAWGFGGLMMLNLFGLRSTDPAALYTVADPVGLGPRGNDEAILAVGTDPGCGRIVAAWGNHGALHQRGAAVLALLAANDCAVHCLGRTRSGAPRHPLYVRATTPLEALPADG